MDLFTYLMAKNGHNTSIHEDLFSYLLGKSQGGGGEIKTATGIMINIPDAKKLVSFMMIKESTQETTQGTNLLNGNILEETTTNGITYKPIYDENGLLLYVLVNGTATSNAWYQFNKFMHLEDGVYTFSIGANGGNNTFRGNVYYNNGSYVGRVDNSATYTITNTEDERVSGDNFRLVVYNGYTANNLKIYPQIIKGSTLTPYEPYTGGIPSPNPDYPQEVKTVKGYRNLYDFVNGNYEGLNNATITRINGEYTISTYNQYSAVLFRQSSLHLKPNTTYTFIANIKSTDTENGSAVYVASGFSSDGAKYSEKVKSGITYITFTTPNTISDTAYIGLYPRESEKTTTFNNLLLVEGDQELPYVPYGNNYVNVAVSDGTNTNNYPIPLNNNEIVGIGDYKDELKVDKSGHVFINKKTGKVVLDENSNISVHLNGTNSYESLLDNLLISKSIITILTNYFLGVSWDNRTTGNNITYGISERGTKIVIRNTNFTSISSLKDWLSTHNTEVYYVLETPELIDLQTTVDLSLFKEVNNVSNSEDGYMTIEYVSENKEA